MKARLAYQRLDGVWLWKVDLKGDAIPLTDGVHQCVGFLMESTCIQRHDADGLIQLRGEVDQDDVFRSKGGCQKQLVAKPTQGVFEDIKGAFAIEQSVELPGQFKGVLW